MVFNEFKFIIAGTVLAIALIGAIYAMFITWQPEPKEDKNTKTEKPPATPIRQRISCFLRDIKASPHYKIGLISVSLTLLIFSVFLISYFGNEEDRIRRRIEKLTHEFNQKVDNHPVEIEKSEPSELALISYETSVFIHNLSSGNAPPEKPKTAWYRRKIILASVSYDVRKTDSLVSPFVADINFGCSVHGKKGDTKESVESGADSFLADPTECMSKYAFQEGHWVKKSVTCKSDFDGSWATPTVTSGIKYQCSSLLPESD